jgi:hypothetical protein
VSQEQAPATRDPFAPVVASPRGRSLLVVGALVAAVLAVVGGLAPVAGPVGMGLGLLAHVKGSRFGMPVTVLAAIAMVIGFVLAFLLR